MSNENAAATLTSDGSDPTLTTEASTITTGTLRMSGWESVKNKLNELAVDERYREKIRSQIKGNATLTLEYIVMNIFATIVACCGLVSSNTSVVMGAMIIAMLLGPIVGVSLALVEGNNDLLKKAALSEGVGMMIVLSISCVFSSYYHANDALLLQSDLIQYTSPNLLDLLIAIIGGAAGTYVTLSKKMPNNLIGVAMSITLVPPLATAGIFFAHGNFMFAANAFFLFVANFVGIQFSSSLVLRLFGFKRHRTRNEGTTHFLKRSALSIGSITLLALILGFNLRTVLEKKEYEQLVQFEVNRELQKFPGAYLDDIKFRTGKDAAIIAVIRTSKDLSKKQVASLDDHLPLRNGKRTKLLVHVIKMTELSREGVEGEIL